MSAARRDLLIFLVAFLAIVLVGLVVVGVSFWTSTATMREDRSLPPCGELPTPRAVDEVVGDHPEVIEKLESLSSSNSVMVSVIPVDGCPQGAALLITYGGLSTRDQIRELLGEDFFGVLYRMRNI